MPSCIFAVTNLIPTLNYKVTRAEASILTPGGRNLSPVKNKGKYGNVGIWEIGVKRPERPWRGREEATGLGRGGRRGI